MTSQRGLALSSLLNFFSSATIARASFTGSASGSGGSDVHQVQQQARALQVLEEADPESCALGGALDEARDVGHDEASVLTDIDDARGSGAAW